MPYNETNSNHNAISSLWVRAVNPVTMYKKLLLLYFSYPPFLLLSHLVQYTKTNRRCFLFWAIPMWWGIWRAGQDKNLFTESVYQPCSKAQDIGWIIFFSNAALHKITLCPSLNIELSSWKHKA